MIVTKSELIEIITAKQKHLPARDVELALKQILEIMSDALSEGERIEIRGFGSFSLHFRPPRQGRNPKTGEAVALYTDLLVREDLLQLFGFSTMLDKADVKFLASPGQIGRAHV